MARVSHEEPVMPMHTDFIRHEMMVHVPMLAHGRVERVLLVGGQGEALAVEVRRHAGVQSIVQVPARFGAGFLADTLQHFDLIVLDSPDRAAPQAGADPEERLRHARGCLRPGGLVIATLGAPFLQPLAFSAGVRDLAAVFPRVAAYLVPVPGTFGGPVAFGWGSNVLSPAAVAPDVVAARFADARLDTRYYTPQVHRAAFALPRFVDELVSAATCPREELADEALGEALKAVRC